METSASATCPHRWPVRTKGAQVEKEPVRHGMGVQIPHCLGAEEATQGDIRKAAAGNWDDTAASVPVQAGGDDRREGVPGPYQASWAT